MEYTALGSVPGQGLGVGKRQVRQTFAHGISEAPTDPYTTRGYGEADHQMSALMGAGSAMDNLLNHLIRIQYVDCR